MEFFETVQKRRSIRQFKPEPFPDEAVKKALEAAVIAPNSSNVQTWDFYWIKNPEIKKQLVHACMNQAAARTASQLVVVTADPAQWKRSHAPLIGFVESIKAPKLVQIYYRKLIPVTYRWGLFNLYAPFKWIAATLVGFTRPITRGPFTRRDLQEVAVKSAALASENLMLAITAQGGASCPMEGFDACRVHRLLKLGCSTRVAMIIGIGYEGERGTWGPQFRLPFHEVVHEV